MINHISTLLLVSASYNDSLTLSSLPDIQNHLKQFFERMLASKERQILTVSFLNNYNKLTNQMTVILQVLIYWLNACSLPQWKSSSNCRRPCSIVRTSATSVRNVCSLHVLPVLPVSGSALPVTATRSVNKGSSSQRLLPYPIVSNMFIYIIKYCFN